MRLIDADRLSENLKWMAKYQPNDKQNTILGVVSTIENTPTVDIKTEVAREIFEEIEMLVAYRRCGDGLLDDCLLNDLAEVKNKYIKDGAE